jgi:phenylalanyl-tRNA synthetase beta chain
MNTLISYNWLKEHLDTKLSPEEFAKVTTNAGNSVERMEHFGKKFEKMVVGVVDGLKAHPDADKLKIAKVDIGNKHVEVVCGGVNLKEGMKVVVGLPGAKVKWHGEGDLVELVEAKIRGVKSHGMICAASEIGFEGLDSDEKNIWDIFNITDAKAGVDLVKALDMDDVVFDIEVTSNRPDCKSVIGQARDAGAATKDRFVFEPTKLKEGSHDFKVTVKEPVLCPKYSAIRLEGVKVQPSPWWLQKKLILSGFRPINNVVDVTNYILHEYGQPLHVFDAKKLAGEEIVVRRAKDNEKIVALDFKEYELNSDMLVIADKKRPVAVAGVMGGEATGATENTTDIVIECATFEPVSIRQTARALSLYSDSQLLFEKGLSTQATEPALARAIELILELTGGHVSSKVTTVEAKKYEALQFEFDPKRANALMGIEMKEKEMTEILERLGFELKESKGIYNVSVPYWRDSDIEASVDFVEEIARVYGYDQFVSVIPSGVLPLNVEDPQLVWQRKVKEFLAVSGMSEMYSYSLVSEKQLKNYGISAKKALKLKNPLSEDQAYMRTSLIPNMLSAIQENQTRFSEADLFELAPVYLPKKSDIPDQELKLVMAVYGKDPQELFLKAKGVLAELMKMVGINDWLLERGADEKLWHKGRSATINVGKKSFGTIGQIGAGVQEAFGIDVATVLVELDFNAVVEMFTEAKAYQPIAQFPSVKRDLAFVVQERTEYESIKEAIKKTSKLIESVGLFDVYRGKGVEQGSKSVAVHMCFRSGEKTLESKDVDGEVEKVRTVLQDKFGAVLRS